MAFLFAENPELAQRARMKLHPTEKATSRIENEELSGMALAARYPVLSLGNFLGVLYGGVLLTGAERWWTGCETLSFNTRCTEAQYIGTVTILFKTFASPPTCLSATTVVRSEPSPPEEVTRHVLTDGKQWVDRALW